MRPTSARASAISSRRFLIAASRLASRWFGGLETAATRSLSSFSFSADRSWSLRTSCAKSSVPAAKRTASCDTCSRRGCRSRPLDDGKALGDSLVFGQVLRALGSQQERRGAPSRLTYPRSVAVRTSGRASAPATLVSGTAPQDCSAMSQHRDDRDRGISHGWPAIACRAARHPHSDLDRGTAPQDCSANRDIGMIGTEGFLADGQRSLVERLGVRIATLGRSTAPQDCSAMSRHRDDRDRGISRRWPAIACRAARHPHSDLGRSTAPQDCSAMSQHRDDRDRGISPDGQRSLVERLGIRIATLVMVQRARLFSDVATSG